MASVRLTVDLLLNRIAFRRKVRPDEAYGIKNATGAILMYCSPAPNNSLLIHPQEFKHLQ